MYSGAGVGYVGHHGIVGKRHQIFLFTDLVRLEGVIGIGRKMGAWCRDAGRSQRIGERSVGRVVALAGVVAVVIAVAGRFQVIRVGAFRREILRIENGRVPALKEFSVALSADQKLRAVREVEVVQGEVSRGVEIGNHRKVDAWGYEAKR